MKTRNQICLVIYWETNIEEINLCVHFLIDGVLLIIYMNDCIEKVYTIYIYIESELQNKKFTPDEHYWVLILLHFFWNL